MDLAYRLALIQWCAALAWGIWLLVIPGPNSVDSLIASIAWCWAGALLLAMKGPRRGRGAAVGKARS